MKSFDELKVTCFDTGKRKVFALYVDRHIYIYSMEVVNKENFNYLKRETITDLLKHHITVTKSMQKGGDNYEKKD